MALLSYTSPATHPRPWLFIHVPKTGGTSIRAAIRGAQPAPTTKDLPQHHGLRQLIEDKHLTWEQSSEVYKFAFVRNPWDRMVSWYFYWQKGGGKRTNATFGEYVRVRVTTEQRLSQWEMVSAYDQLAVDHLGRFEELELHFAAICFELNLTASLPRLNTAETRPRDYREMYRDDPELIELVRRRYPQDVEKFGYTYEPAP